MRSPGSRCRDFFIIITLAVRDSMTPDVRAEIFLSHLEVRSCLGAFPGMQHSERVAAVGPHQHERIFAFADVRKSLLDITR